MWAGFQDKGDIDRGQESWNSILRMGQVPEHGFGKLSWNTILGLKFSSFELEKRLKVCVYILIGDIVKFEGVVMILVVVASTQTASILDWGGCWSQRNNNWLERMTVDIHGIKERQLLGVTILRRGRPKRRWYNCVKMEMDEFGLTP